jgi:predicted transcriptional regulator
VLTFLWSRGPADVKQVHRAIGAAREITSNTVQSTLERLFRKDLLRREKVSHAFVYAPAVTREELGAELVQDVVHNVLGGDSGSMISAFVDLTARSGEDALARLERSVAERRARDAERRSKGQ